MADRAVVTLSLISHTNVGKTTLARTLLRRDIGEVRDQSHVTDVSEAHTLIETPAATLKLWDTPGFGDTTRLLKRLRRQADPVGWFLHQVWDRWVDRPLWCSQEAVRNIKEEADVVLYLVNASEDPQDAGYVPHELELLTWIGRPVMILLNQVGGDASDVMRRWREFTKQWPVVRHLLSLDAFTRCWVEEAVLLHRVSDLLEGDDVAVMQELAAAWDRRNLAVFETACQDMAAYLVRTAVDGEAPDASSDGAKTVGLLDSLLRAAKVPQKRAMEALSERLDKSTADLMGRMIAGHGLEGASATRIEKQLQDFQVRGMAALDERSGALAGAVLSGALGGLAADALSGGLTLGGGIIAGGILGMLGGSALARGYRMISGDDPSVRWSPEFLDQLFGQVLLRYLSVAHFGRGRGEYRDLEEPEHWSRAVQETLAASRDELRRVWSDAERKPPDESELQRSLARLLHASVKSILRDAYPEVSDQVLA